jgi:amino-acid N-acetyltransferase
MEVITLMVIRKAIEEDVNSIESIFDLCGLDFDTPIDGNCIVIELEKRIIGAGCIKITENRSEITSIAVLPEFQHKGFGDGLLRALINFADRRSVKLINVKTNCAKGFFKKIGFVTVAQNNEMVLDVDEFFKNTHCKN